MLGQAVKAPPADALFPLLQIQTIIGSALLEGAAFFFLIAYIFEGQSVCLIAAGILAAQIAMKFPTHERVDAWINQQQELYLEDKARGAV